MRELTFTLRERLVLIPIELVIALKGSLWILPLIALATGWRGGTFVPAASLPPMLGYLGAVAAGTVVTPLALPWLPTRSFAIKGAAAGILWALLFLALTGWRGPAAAATLLLLGSVSAFLGLNFTGSTPFTSRSGVKKEMRLAMPPLAAALVLGFGLGLAAALS
jgi:acetyl-CoA decarbonylase/synthase complex subunit gamma